MRALLALTLLVTAASAQTPRVHTLQGEATGKVLADGQHAFLGLPYAAPPVGTLRFKPPQAPIAWTGTRDASTFGHRCMQPHIWNDYVFLDEGQSEDCLVLNVYTPSSATPKSKLPVMVWIYGGGFVAGAGSEPRYTNSGLVAKGVILVTINYRLGIFGFLATADLAHEADGHAGNYGLMDQAAALRWVHANIHAFGGDPENVTIFGESAGSFSVNALTAAPEARGLFKQAIGESGAFFGATLPLTSLADRETRNTAWLSSIGVNNLTDLRAMPAEKLLEAAAKAPVGAFSPVVDGAFLTEPVAATYAANREAHIPMIIGWNRDERTNTLSKGMTVAKWRAFATEHYPGQADAFLAAFPATTDAEAVRAADDYTTAQFIALGAWQWAEADKTNAPLFRYRFDRPAPPSDMHPEGRYAWHSDELEYVFGTLNVRTGSTWLDADRSLSNEIITYWANFAKTGNPNGKDVPLWPRYDTTGKVLHLDQPTTTSADTTHAEFEFLRDHPSAK